MAIKELTGFLKEGLERGLPREQLEEVLLEAGWAPDQVRGALGGFADVEFPIPVPRPKPYLFAREAFVYLVLFSTLYLSAFNLGSLLFQFINRAFPDPAVDPVYALEASREAIRWSISALVVAFPVFLFVSWTNDRAVRHDPSRRLSKVRRWNVLGGEMTTRFALKVLTVGAIAGSVFGYFHRDLRREEVVE
jgi:hypothetical protein